MASEPPAPAAVLDACVLYPFHLRNLLVQLGADRLYRPRWTEEIHEEWIGSLLARTPTLDRARLERTRELMRAVLPEADVIGHQALVPRLELPDPDDRHVLAAALAGGAGTIVTWNLRDFPDSALAPHGVQAVSPDDFVLSLADRLPQAVLASTENARANLRQAVPSRTDYVAALEAQRMKGFAAWLGRQAPWS